MFIRSLMLLCATAVLACGQDLTGLWVGQYKYTADNPDGEHLFSLQLSQEGTIITGKGMEANTFGLPSWKYLTADLVGELVENRLKLYKKYDGTGLQNHVVIYEGVVTEGRIDGTWRLNNAQGIFEILRIQGEQFFKPAAEKAKPSKF